MTSQNEQIRTGALLANWAYDYYKAGARVPDGYAIVKPVDGQGTGLNAVILRDTTTGNYIFAVAGTNEGVDAAHWHSALTGYGSNKAQINVAVQEMRDLDQLALAEGKSVFAAGHSMAGQFTDIGSAIFGWNSVKVDAIGGGSVVGDAAFLAMLAGMGVSPSSSPGQVISLNVNGLGPLGGGVVGNRAGWDLPGTIHCQVELPMSTASGIIHGVATWTAGPGAMCWATGLLAH